jgi:hypothetical protein
MKEKPVYLRALDLEVNIPENVYFWDDGFVKDIQGQTAFINWKYTGKLGLPENSSTKYFSAEITPDTAGLILAFHKKKISEYYFHIFYLENSSIRTRGHEETHFLHAIKRLKNLEDAMKFRTGVEIDFNYLKNSMPNGEKKYELIAELGSIFALSQREGWESVINFAESKNPRSVYFSEAYEIFSRARKSTLRNSRKNSFLSFFKH